MAPSAQAVQLTNDTSYDSWWAKPSPDGTKILFYRTPAGVHDTNYAETSLWMMNSDGSDQHQLIATGANSWSIQGHAEWSPDGSELVMVGGETIWITDTSGNVLHSVTTGLDPTFTPDGQQIVYVSCADLSDCTSANLRVFRVNVDGSDPTQLENLPYRANDPSTSPNGNTIVWETNISGLVWDIAEMNSDGSDARILYSDNNINTDPTWSPDNIIYFTKTEPTDYTAYGLWTMNADASDLQWISSGQTGSNEYVSVIP
jgi:TolB protein